jgi:O-antigen/teichoic acid export membrane protein
MTSVLPLLTRSRQDELNTVVEWSVAYMASIGCLIAAGIICLGSQTVRMLAGNKFASSVAPLSILAISVVFSGLTNVFGYAAFARNRHQKLIYVSVSSLVLNVVLNVIAIPRWGVRGSAGATLVSEAVVLAGTYAVFRHGVGIRTAVVRALIRPTVAAGTVIAVFRFWLWSPHAGAALSLLVGVGVIVLFVAVLALLGGLPPELRTVGRRMLNTALRREQ